MGAGRRRGIFEFQVECFQDGAEAPEEWSVATRMCRSIKRWSAYSRKIRSRQFLVADPERCAKLYIKEGLTSPYSQSLAPLTIPRPSKPPPPPANSPYSNTSRSCGSSLGNSPQNRSVYSKHSAPIRVSVGPPIPKTNVPGRIPGQKASPSRSERGFASPFRIVPRPILKTPAIAILSSDDESLPGANNSNLAPQTLLNEAINDTRSPDRQPQASPKEIELCQKARHNLQPRPSFEPSNNQAPVSPAPGPTVESPSPENSLIIPRSRKEPLGPAAFEVDYSDTESDERQRSPPSVIVEIESGADAEDLIHEELAKVVNSSKSRGKRPSPTYLTGPQQTEKKKKKRLSFNGIPFEQVMDTVTKAWVVPPADINEFDDPSQYVSLPTFEDAFNENRPFKRYDIPGGIMFYEDDALGDLALVSLDKRSRIFPMFAKQAILSPSPYIGPLDDIGHTILKLAQSHASELYCMIRRRKITLDLFNQVILLHHASEAFYLTLDLVAARILKNCDRRRMKPPLMKDKQVRVFPACTDCSSFIAVTSQLGVDQAFCLFCDLQYSNITRENGVQAIEYSNILQPHTPPGGYMATDADLSISEHWLNAATKHPGPILSFLFSVFAMLPPGWGNNMIRQIAAKGPELKLCGLCGLGSIVGHSWHDTYRCTWCMGTRSTTHQRNSRNPDKLLYHIEHACKTYKAIDSENSYLSPIMPGNVTGESNSDPEPYLTPTQGPVDYYPHGQSTLGAPVDLEAYHTAEFISENTTSLMIREDSSFTGLSEMRGSINPITGLANPTAAGMTTMFQTIGAQGDQALEYGEQQSSQQISPTLGPTLQRCDATSPASTSPRLAPCFPIERANWGATDGGASANETIDKMTDSLIAKITTTAASEHEEPVQKGATEMELDYEVSEEGSAMPS